MHAGELGRGAGARESQWILMAEALEGGEESRFDAHTLEVHMAAVEVRLKCRWLGMAQ